MRNHRINNRVKKPVWAVLLVVVGVLLLLSTLDVIKIEDNNIYLCIGLAVAGVIFHVSCFFSKPPRYQLLVPGGILISMSAFFITLALSENLDIMTLWPIIILCVAFGMLEQKVLSRGTQGSWVSISLLALIGVFFLIQENMSFGVAVSIALIVIGAAMFATSIRGANIRNNSTTSEAKKGKYELDDDEVED